MTTIKNSLFWKILVFIFITLVATMILGMIQQFSSISYTSITLPQFAPALAALSQYGYSKIHIGS